MKMRGTFVFDPEVVGLRDIKLALSGLNVEDVKFNMSVERASPEASMASAKTKGKKGQTATD